MSEKKIEWKAGDRALASGYAMRANPQCDELKFFSREVVNVASREHARGTIKIVDPRGVELPEGGTAYYIHVLNLSPLPVEEPKPLVGDWRCVKPTTLPVWFCSNAMEKRWPLTSPCPYQNRHEVYRASGWSADSRKGQRREGKAREFKVGEDVIRHTEERVRVEKIFSNGVQWHAPAYQGTFEQTFGHIERRTNPDRRGASK